MSGFQYITNQSESIFLTAEDGMIRPIVQDESCVHHLELERQFHC